jgi:hypothetical protein
MQRSTINADGTVTITQQELAILLADVGCALRRSYESGNRQLCWQGYAADPLWRGLDRLLYDMRARTTAATLGIDYEQWSK